MSIEIEKKARIKDFEKVKEKLESMFGIGENYEVHKKDVMYRTSDGESWRIRYYPNKDIEFCHKNKLIENGVEINEENECLMSVKDGDFSKFLESINIKPKYSKKKNGYEFYTRRNIEYYGDEYSCEFHIELCNVSSVTGYSDNFLEIEYTGDILKNVKSKEYPNGYWTFTNDIIKTSSIVESLEKLFEEIGETDFEDKKYVELILGE